MAGATLHLCYSGGNASAVQCTIDDDANGEAADRGSVMETQGLRLGEREAPIGEVEPL